MSGTIADTPPPRPSFTNGQYIGADDLNAAVAYARDETRRLSLSGRTWGIAGGLALVEIPDATGAIQMWIEPGMAWDGYGRPIVLASPVPVTADVLAGLPSGNQTIWLYYQSVGTEQVQPGFQVCGAGDPATRMTETFGVSAGNPTVQQRSGGVIINGVSVADPREMLVAVDQNSDVILDGTVPYQAFPADNVPWLVPVGIVSYTAGTPGSFSARTSVQLALNRCVRRYANTVAESVLAADGVLRLRDRQSDGIAANSTAIDNADSAAAIQTTDIEVDPKNATRMIGEELVWVEGNMRVIGDARLWGTKLELRDTTGVTTNGVPEYIQRSGTLNAQGGQDLDIVFGAATGTPGEDRLVFGTVDGSGTVYTQAVFRTDAKAALGTDAIDSYSTLANNLVIAGTADTGISIASNGSSTANIFFAINASTPTKNAGFITYDQQQAEMNFGVVSTEVMSLTADGQMVIGPVDGTLLANNFAQLAIANPAGGGTRLLLESQNAWDEISFANGTAAPRAGAIHYDMPSNAMSFFTNSAPQVYIDKSGNVGIATSSPGALLDICDPSSTQDLHLSSNSVQARTGGNPSNLLLQNAGGAIGVGVDPPHATLHVRTGGGASLVVEQVSGGNTSTSLFATGSSVSVGHHDNPRTVLDVQGNVAPGTSPTPSSHIAVIQNTQAAPADVLALQCAIPDSTSVYTSYITFFDESNNVIGSIDGLNVGAPFGNVTIFTGYSQDYAEAVKRAPGTPQIGPGRIVGVSNGLVSLDTDNADAVFVTSLRPAMVGGAPPREQRGDYEFLAFLGQVHVTIEGPCNPGDLIVPSGKADGYGRAIAPNQIQPADIPRVIGQAWASSGSGQTSQVNVLVGPGVATPIAATPVLSRQATSVQALTDQLAQQATQLQTLTDASKEQSTQLQALTDTAAAQAAEIKTLTDRTAMQAAELGQLAEAAVRQAEEIRRLTELVLGGRSRD